MAYSPVKFDIGIVRADGVTNVGMMLLQADNAPIYQMFDDEYLANQFFTGAPGYASLPSEKEIAIRQDSWRAGFGLDVFDSDEPERYYWSRGMDMRFRGMVIAGQSPVNVTNSLPPNLTITFGGLESWATVNVLSAPWDTYSDAPASGTSVAREASVVYEGTYSARLKGTAVGDRARIEQDVAGWGANAPGGKTLTMRAFIRSAGPQMNIGLKDDFGGTYATGPIAVNVWEWLAVSRVMNVSSTTMRMMIHQDSGTTGAYIDKVQLAVNGSIVSFAEYNDKLFFNKGSNLLQMNATGVFLFTGNLPVNVTDIKPFTDSKLYIAQNTGDPYFALNTAEGLAPVNVSLPNNAFQFFESVFSSTPAMWGNDGNNTIRKNTTPDNVASWSGQTTVGSNYHNITDLLTRQAALFIMKEDIPYYLNSSEQVQNDLAPKLAALTSSNSGKNSHTDGEKIWIPAGDQSLIEEDAGVLTWRTPSLFATKITQLSGRIAALTSDDQWLYAVINGTGVVYVLAGRTEVIGSTSQWVWHGIAEVPITACETAYVSSVYQKRLWISSTTGELYYIPLFADYGNPTSDTNRSFQSNVEVETPFLHANFKDTSKAYPKVTALLGHAYNASVFFNCYFKKLEDTSWTQLSDLVGNSTSREATSFFPSNTYSNMIRLKFVANTAYTDKTPELLSYNVQGILNPPRRNIYAMAVRVGQEVLLKDGTIDKGSQQTIIDTLDELRAAKWPVAFYDIDGTLKYVRSLPLPGGTPRMQVIMNEKLRKQERVMNLLLQEVAVS